MFFGKFHLVFAHTINTTAKEKKKKIRRFMFTSDSMIVRIITSRDVSSTEI